MPKMKVVQVSKAGGNFELVERNIPEPGRNQVRIKVEACGICHSDAVVKEGYWPGIQYPRVPGHEIAGRIDAVVHFAGMGLRGFFEDLSMQEIRRLYDVNVFGIMELTQAVLPHMRARRSGRIVITASAAGRMGEMSIAGYSSGKFAVVGLGECLRQEMALLNIHVSVLEPGLIYTPHFGINRNRARRAVDPASPYYFWFCQHEAIVDKLLATNKFTTVDIARVVYKILTARRPRLHYMVGFKLKLMVTLRDLIPFEWFERIHQKIIVRMVTKPRRPATGLSGLDAGIGERVLSKAHD